MIQAALAATSFAQALPNGVAAGDVDQTSAVLWTRSTVLGPVIFDYSVQPDLALTARVESVVLDPMVPVKVEVTGLRPGTQYYYRVTNSAAEVADGTFRTAHVDGLHGLRFGVTGDWRAELRPYPAISNVAQRDLDFLIALGDTIYADFPSDELPLDQARTLAEFRIKHNEGYSSRFGVNSWSEVRASTAWFATIDDHEVTNDFAGGAPAGSDPRFDSTGDFLNESQLFNNGLQAFQEFNPIRDEVYGETGDPRTAEKRKLYRFRTFGADAAFFMLDARSFRDAGLEELLTPPGPREFREYVRSSFDPSRTMLGQVQLDDLFADVLEAEALGVTWKFILVPEPIQNLGPILSSDRFEGYAYERTRILAFLEDHAVENVVFISADIHGTVVNNITYQSSAEGRQRRTPYLEITTGSTAFAAPFGPTTLEFAPPLLRTIYMGLKGEARDALVRSVANVLLRLYGYPAVGLRGSPVNARLLEGSYMAVHSYGWTEFDIDAATQRLTITTYGIEWYDEAEMLADPQDILARQPTVVSRFTVNPQRQKSLQPDRATATRPRSPCGAMGGTVALIWPIATVLMVFGGSTRPRGR